MSCLSMGFLEQLLIMIVVCALLVGIFRLLAPLVMGWLGNPPAAGVVLTILGWVIGAIILIWFIELVFSCVGGGGFPAIHFTR